MDIAVWAVRSLPEDSSQKILPGNPRNTSRQLDLKRANWSETRRREEKKVSDEKYDSPAPTIPCKSPKQSFLRLRSLQAAPADYRASHCGATAIFAVWFQG